MYNNKRNYGLMPRTFSGLMDDVFQNGWNNIFSDDHWNNVGIPVNIHETESAFELDVIAPGLKKEDFNVQVDKDKLTISFEQKEQTEEKKENEPKTLRKEYHFRSFKRSFNLGEKVNTSDINASYADGVLKVTLPKKEKVEASKQVISVK